MPGLNFGTHFHPVYVQEDDDSDVETILQDIEFGGSRPRRNRTNRNRQVARSSRNSHRVIIDCNDDDDDDADDDVTFMLQTWAEAEEELERDIINLSGDTNLPDLPYSSTKPQNRRSLVRNDLLVPPAVHLSRVTWFQHTLKPRMTVEVDGLGSRRYLRITEIIHSPAGVMLRGVQYVHMVDMQGMLPWFPDKHGTDICAIYHVDLDDPRAMHVQAAVQVALNSVKRVCALRVSNALWPLHALADGNLVCRWKFVQYFPSARVRERHLESYSLYQGLEAAILRNDETDADADCTVRRETLRTAWAEHPRTPGGSYIPPHAAADPLTNRSDSGGLRQRLPGQKYTFFDAFCGAGGASRGAMRAGLHLRYAVDAWDRACDSYQANFPQTQLFRLKIDEWIRHSVASTTFHCDVLHLSPPCQVFSPAHTINSRERDEANFAALFACEAVVQRVKPRVFTLEQTFGLLHRRWRPVFYHLIASFTGCGYSVRWKYVFLPQWGLPARRKRLIMIGAAPGETLPGFPAATHGDGDSDGDGAGARNVPGLLPLVTVRQALRKLDGSRRHDPLHRPGEMKRKNMPRWDTDGILTRCVTTSGGQNYHYSGQRCFTHREFAILQGFPMYHVFVGSFRIRQIGNAFPPCTALVLFRHIEKCLLEADGVQVDEGDSILADAMAVEVDDGDESDGYEVVGDDDDEGEEDEEDVYFRQILEQSKQEYSAMTSRRDGRTVLSQQNNGTIAQQQTVNRQSVFTSKAEAGELLDLTQDDDDDDNDNEWRQMLTPSLPYSYASVFKGRRALRAQQLGDTAYSSEEQQQQQQQQRYLFNYLYADMFAADYYFRRARTDGGRNQWVASKEAETIDLTY